MSSEFDDFSGGFGPEDFGRPDSSDFGDDPFAAMAGESSLASRKRSRHSRRFLTVGLGFYGKLKAMKVKKKG